MDNTKCHVCGKEFGEDYDNIVFCPECHAYHHEKCWTSNGGCGNRECTASPQYKKPEEKIEINEQEGEKASGVTATVRVAKPLERSSEKLPPEDCSGWFSRFFENPGRKLKTYAKYSFIVELIVLWVASFIFLCLGIATDPAIALIAIGAAILALPVAYIGVLPIYAFGELVDRATRVDKKIK